MPYAHYAHATREHIFELFRSITPDEQIILSRLLSQMSEELLFQWYQDNLDDVSDFLRATPSERKKKKKWKDPETAVMLKYIAYREANKAYSLLYAIGVNNLPCSGPQRVMTAEAADAYYFALVSHFPAWPFESPAPPWMENPFAQYGEEQLS